MLHGGLEQFLSQLKPNYSHKKFPIIVWNKKMKFFRLCFILGLQQVTRCRVTFSSEIYQSFFLEVLLILTLFLTILTIGDILIFMWTVKILHLIPSFCLGCFINVFCLSFVYKQQCKHFRGTVFIPSIYSHSLKGCTPAIIYNNSYLNIEILFLISIQLAADNWQISMQNRQLSLSTWFKLSWIYFTR